MGYKRRVLTKDLLMVPNLKHPPKKMGKNDQRVDAQVDRPGVMAMYCPQLIDSICFFNLKTLVYVVT